MKELKKKNLENMQNEFTEEERMELLNYYCIFENNQIDLIENLLNSKIDLNKKNSNGFTTLDMVVAYTDQNKEIINFLIQKKSDPNSRNDLNGYTSLFIACISRNIDLEVISALLNGKADPNLQDKQGITPLYLSCGLHHPLEGVVELLIDKGADPNIKNNLGRKKKISSEKKNFI